MISQLDPDMLTPTGGHNALWIIGVALPTFLFLFGESGMYQKFFSARDAGTARRSVVGMLAGIMVIEVCIALLAISGELNPELGGVPIRPEINQEVALHFAVNEEERYVIAGAYLDDPHDAAMELSQQHEVIGEKTVAQMAGVSGITQELPNTVLRIQWGHEILEYSND